MSTQYEPDVIYAARPNRAILYDSQIFHCANHDNAYDVRTIDISLVVRSSKPFYRSDIKLDGKPREIKNITKDRTEIKEEDKYLRETISVTANARNIGLE